MTNLFIGGGLTLVGLIMVFILWIIAMVKAFKSGNTVWGILTLLFSILVGTIFFFVKGHTKLGVTSVFAILLYLAGAGFATFAMQDPEVVKNLEGMMPEGLAPAE